MNKLSPIIYVSLNNRNISEYIETVTISDEIVKNSELRLDIKEDYVLLFADSVDISPDNVITIQFGFLNNVITSPKTFQISDIELKYAERITMTIKCMDKGIDLKKQQRQTVWTGTNAEIVKKIAEEYNLKTDIDDNNFKLLNGNVPQGNKSDFEFISYLAEHETNYVKFWITDNTLFYKNENYSKKESSITFTVGSDKRIISFNPIWSVSKVGNVAGNIAAVKSDGKDNKVISPTDKTDRLANAYEVYDIDGKYKRTSVNGQTNTDKKTKTQTTWTESSEKASVVTTATTPDDIAVQNKVNNLQNKEAQKGITAKLTIEGSPLLQLTDIITISGTVANRHKGNWSITAITHRINASGAITTISLIRDSINKVSGDKLKNSGNSNKTKGEENKKQTKELNVEVYDFNGNKVNK